MGGTTATATDVENAYLAYFGRPADPEGMNYWLGKSIATMQAGFAASQEYQNLYGGMTNKQMVTQVYSNLLGRAPDVGGLAYWVNQLNIGAATVSTIVTQMQADAQGIDIATLANRFVYAIHFTEDLTSHSQIVGYEGTAAANAARVAVSQVLNTASSLATAESNMALDIQAVDKGESPVALAAANAAAAATAATAASNLASYGSINGVTQTSAANTFALSSGANTVTMVVGSSAVTDTFTVNSGTTGLIINDSGSATGALTIGWAGTPTSLATVTVNDSSAAALTLNAVTDNAMTSLTLNNTGTSTLTASGITSTALATLNIQGSGTVMETALNSSTAAFTVNDTSSVVQSTSITDANLTNLTLNNTGGSTLTFAHSGNYNVQDSINASTSSLLVVGMGGLGSTDITHITNLAATASLTIQDSNGSVGVDVGNVTTTQIGAAGTNILTVNIGGGSTGYAQAYVDSLTVTGDGSLTINNAQGSGSTSANDIMSLVDGGVTTLNITGSGSHGLAIVAITDTALTTINMESIAPVTIGDVALATLNITGSTTGSYDITLTDTLAGTLTIDDSTTSTGNTDTVALGTASTVTGLTVDDSSTQALTLAAFTDNYLTALTLDNSGGVLLHALGVTDSYAGALTVSDAGSGAVTLTSLTLSGAGTHTVTNSGNGTLTIGTFSDSTSANTLTITNSGTSGSIMDSADTTTATTVAFTNSSTGTITETNMTANSATAINLAALVTGTIGDSSTGGIAVSGSTDNSAISITLSGASGTNTVAVGTGADSVTSGAAGSGGVATTTTITDGTHTSTTAAHDTFTAYASSGTIAASGGTSTNLFVSELIQGATTASEGVVANDRVIFGGDPTVLTVATTSTTAYASLNAYLDALGVSGTTAHTVYSDNAVTINSSVCTVLVETNATFAANAAVTAGAFTVVQLIGTAHTFTAGTTAGHIVITA
jgi:S-layer protein